MKAARWCRGSRVMVMLFYGELFTVEMEMEAMEEGSIIGCARDTFQKLFILVQNCVNSSIIPTTCGLTNKLYKNKTPHNSMTIAFTKGPSSAP